MSKVSVYNQTGEKVTDLDLNPKIFGLDVIDTNLVHSAVRAQRNNARTALAHTKMRGEVSGSGKKPWKQKGTGNARAGSIRSPLWRKGGITFGPRNERDYSVKINRSAWRKALFTILSDKLKGNKLVVVENLENTSKTNVLAKQLANLAIKAGLGKKVALIVADNNNDLQKASRNLNSAKLLVANKLNIIDLLNYDTVITKDALNVIEKTYLKS